MWKYIARRFTYMIFTVWVISLVSFVVIQLPPGDYVSSMIARLIASGQGKITPDFEQQMREMYGFNKPIYIQYLSWVKNIVLHGNFGYSFIYLRDAKTMLFERLPMSFTLSISSMFFVWAVALPIGVYSAVRKYSLGDYFFTFIGFIGLAVPNFLLALLVLFMTYKYMGQAMIGLFSEQYAAAPWSFGKVLDLFKHIWVPMIIIGVGGTAGMIRTMRANLLDELNKPYVDTARSKGLSERRLLWKYPVRHALNPFVSTLGWALPGLVSGEAIVSIVLNLPTSGPVILDSLMKQDMYVASGFILLLSTLTVIGTFVSDVLLALLDPRIRME